jgi:hypothetical protein
MTNNDIVTANTLGIAYIRPEAVEIIGTKYGDDILPRIRHSISQSGKNTTLKVTDYQKIRDLHAQGRGVFQIADELKHDRSIIPKIIEGQLHYSEFNRLPSVDQVKYLEEYLIPKFVAKDIMEENKERMTVQEFATFNKANASINKRVIKDAKLLMSLVALKLSICDTNPNRYYTQQEIIDRFADHPEYNKLSTTVLTNLWNGRSSLYESEFTPDMPITYQRYKELVDAVRPRKLVK